MKILVVTSSYPRHAGDIAGRFVLEWVEQLERLAHTARVLTWRDSSGDNPPPSTRHEVVRVPYAPPAYERLFYGAGTPENLRENPVRALLAAPAASAMLARMALEIARFRPDVLVGHWLVPSGLLVRAAGRLAGIPTLVVGHSGGVHLLDGLPGFVSAPLARFVASGPTTLPSLPLATKLGRLSALSSRPEILPMGFTPPTRRERAARAAADWLCMGRLVDIKGVDLAIEAFARADLTGEPTLHIAGDGPLRARLERSAKGTGARVQFHGFVTGQAKEALWGQCSHAIFASKQLDDGRHEGLPVSFLEACSRGIVPLCASIPGLGAYLADRELQQIDERDPHERDPQRWARGIERLAALDARVHTKLAQEQTAAVGELEWPRLILRWDGLLRRASHA